MIVRELFAKLGIQVDEASMARADGFLNRLKTGLISLGTAYGVNRAFGQIADTARKLTLLSQDTGIAVQEFQALSQAANMLGVDTNTLQMNLSHFARRAEEAVIRGGEAGATFMRLGIQVRDLATGRLRPMNQLLREVADRFQKMPDGVLKTALAVELFYRNGAQMIPILNKGSKGLDELEARIRKTGATMSDKLIAKGDKLKESFQFFGLAITGLNNAVFGPFVERLTKVTDLFTLWIEQHRFFLSSKIQGLWTGLAGTFEMIAAGAERYTTAFKVLAGVAALVAAAFFPLTVLFVGIFLTLEEIFADVHNGKGRDSLLNRIDYSLQKFETTIKRRFERIKGYIRDLMPDWAIRIVDSSFFDRREDDGTFWDPGTNTPIGRLGELFGDFLGSRLGPLNLSPYSAFDNAYGGSGDITVNNTFNGPANPEDVHPAVKRAIHDALEEDRRKAKKW